MRRLLDSTGTFLASSMTDLGINVVSQPESSKQGTLLPASFILRYTLSRSNPLEPLVTALGVCVSSDGCALGTSGCGCVHLRCMCPYCPHFQHTIFDHLALDCARGHAAI